MGEVVSIISVPPRSKTHYYQDFTVTITFNSKTRRWDWVAVKQVTTEIELSGSASTEARAYSNAKQQVNQV